MLKIFKVPLILEPQEEGGWTVTSPVLPELVTEIEKIDELQKIVSDAIRAVIELYADMNKELPPGLSADGTKSPVWFESLVPAEI